MAFHITVAERGAQTRSVPKWPEAVSKQSRFMATMLHNSPTKAHAMVEPGTVSQKRGSF